MKKYSRKQTLIFADVYMPGLEENLRQHPNPHPETSEIPINLGEGTSSRKRLIRTFERALAGEGIAFARGERTEITEDGITITEATGSLATARLPFEQRAAPPETDWEYEPTRTAIVLRQGVLSASIQDMRNTSTAQGGFHESGGAIMGTRCQHGDMYYTTGVCYIPLPEGTERNAIQLRFSPEAWAQMYRAQDALDRQFGVQLNLATWIHCHPGAASPSNLDMAIQTGHGPWSAIIIGHDLLTQGLPAGEEHAAGLRRYRSQGQLVTMGVVPDPYQPPIGFVNQVTAGTHFLKLDPTNALDFPLMVKPIEPLGQIAQPEIGDEIRIIRAEPEAESQGQLNIDILQELPQAERQDTVVVTQADIDGVAPYAPQITIRIDIPDEDDLGIVILPHIEISMPGETVPSIIINGITEVNIDEILRGVRRLLGF